MKTTYETPKTSRLHLIFEIAGIIGLILLIGIPWFFYNKIPDEIPTHFGVKGFADDWGPKNNIWLLPVIGFVIYAVLSSLNFFLVRTTPSGKTDIANENRQKEGVYELLQFLKVTISISFAYLVFASIQVSRGNQEGLGQWFLPVFILILTVVPMLFVLRFRKRRKANKK